MLTEEHVKEDLSRSYVQAVGAMAGAIVSINDRGLDYGMDGSFHEVSIIDGYRVESGITLDFQLKATTRIITHDECVQFSLDVRTVNMLAARSQRCFSTPAILIILNET